MFRLVSLAFVLPTYNTNRPVDFKYTFVRESKVTLLLHFYEHCLNWYGKAE